MVCQPALVSLAPPKQLTFWQLAVTGLGKALLLHSEPGLAAAPSARSAWPLCVFTHLTISKVCIVVVVVVVVVPTSHLKLKHSTVQEFFFSAQEFDDLPGLPLQYLQKLCGKTSSGYQDLTAFGQTVSISHELNWNGRRAGCHIRSGILLKHKLKLT